MPHGADGLLFPEFPLKIRQEINVKTKLSVIAAVATMCLPLIAQATTQPDPLPNKGDAQNQAQGQGQAQGQEQDQRQQQGQGQLQSQNTDVDQTNAQTVDAKSSAVTSAQQSITYKQVKQAPNVYTAVSNTTAACIKASGFGASVPGFGAGLSLPIKDKDCLLDRAADKELDRNNLGASIALRCRISYYREALGEDCVALLHDETLPEGSSTVSEKKEPTPAPTLTIDQKKEIYTKQMEGK